MAQWADQRWKTGDKRGKKLKTDEVVELAWQARWEQQRAGQQGVGSRRMADEDPPTLLFTNKALKRHEGLTKAQSTLLSQARIGDIGLKDYLFKVKVPEVRTPYCGCGEGKVSRTDHMGGLEGRSRGAGRTDSQSLDDQSGKDHAWHGDPKERGLPVSR